MTALATATSLRRVNQRGELAVASFGALLAFLDVSIVNVAFPSVQSTFPHTSISDLSWVLNAYSIVFASVLVPAGRFADLLGRRRLFRLGLLVFTVASAWCATAPSVSFLVLARAFQGLGAGMIVPASLALVVQSSRGARRSHAISVWGATTAVAVGLGPPLGGALVALAGWRAIFVVNIPVGIAAIAIARRALVESRTPGRRQRPDLLGALVQASSVALLVFGVVQSQVWGWGDVRVLLAYAGSVAAIGVFLARTRSHAAPIIDSRLLRSRSFAVPAALTAIAGMGSYAYMLDNVLWLNRVWGYDVLGAGLAVAPGVVVAALVAIVAGRLADAHGSKWIAAGGALVWAGAFAWYLYAVGPQPQFFSAWLPGQVLSGIGVGATVPVLAGAALGAVPGGRYAGASALVSVARQLGGVLGVAIVVVLIASPRSGTASASGLRDGWIFTCACFLVVALGGLLIRRGDVAVEVADEPVRAPVLSVTDQPIVETAAGQGTTPGLLEGLPDSLRHRLLDSAERLWLPAHADLFRAGDVADAMYVVQTGRIEIVVGDEVVRTLGADAVIGELGVLTGGTRSATARARRDSRLLRISRERWDSLVGTEAVALRTVAAGLAAQLQRTSAPAADPHSAPRVVAVVGHGPAREFPALAAALHAELARRVRVAAPGVVDAEGLERAEFDADRVLLVAATTDDPRWREFCVAHADHLVVVADRATLPPTQSYGVPSYVILVGGTPTSGQLTQWHDAVAPRRVYDGGSAVASAATIRSVAARIAGQSIGLAIAGGGARSLAAIGVLDELVHAGIEIDRLSGSSMGSVVAALFATGRDPDAVDAACYEEFVRRNPFNDYVVPTVAMSRGRKSQAAIARQVGDRLFEELPRELVVVSTDLLRRQSTVHRRGHVATAVRASLALPGLYPPVRIGDALHVDGGILDNLPVSPLADRDEGPVVAVNIGAGAVLSSRNGPPRMPALGETLLRSLLMAGTPGIDEQRGRAAVVVTPDTRGVGLLEFHQIDRLREAGRAAGRAVVEALRAGDTATITLPEPTPAGAGTE